MKSLFRTLLTDLADMAILLAAGVALLGLLSWSCAGRADADTGHTVPALALIATAGDAKVYQYHPPGRPVGCTVVVGSGYATTVAVECY